MSKSIQVVCTGLDDWYNELYRDINSGEVYVFIHNTLYTRSLVEGEPVYPLSKDIQVEFLTCSERVRALIGD